MTRQETDMDAKHAAWAIAIALAVIAGGPFVTSGWAQDAESEAPAPPGEAGLASEPPEAASEADAESSSGDAAVEALPPEKPISEMTEEEFLELPPFKRFDIPWEEGEELLNDVKDGTYDYDEPGFYWLVRKVHEIDIPDDMFDPETDLVPYSQLLATPSAFRGKPVLIKGAYASVTPWRVPVIALRKDIPRLYTVSLKEFPLRQTSLVATVVAIEDPMRKYRRGDVVQAVGYFYKVRKYQNEDGDVFSAPMLIAKRLEATAKPVPPTEEAEGIGASGFLLAGAFGVLVLMLAAFIVIRNMGKQKSDAAGGRLPHRIRLRRPDGAEPFGEGGPGSETAGEEPQRQSPD
jgi:hypothetical protein